MWYHRYRRVSFDPRKEDHKLTHIHPEVINPYDGIVDHLEEACEEHCIGFECDRPSSKDPNAGNQGDCPNCGEL